MENLNFDNLFEIAKEYYEEYGNLKIFKNIIFHNFELGYWIQKIRANKKYLTKVQIEKLNSIGMNWNNKNSAWEDYFCLAQKYYKKYGHLRLKQREIFEGYKLGGWLNNQRCRKNRLSDIEIKRLESIGMVWNLTNDFWDRHFKAAQEYYKKYGNLSVPKGYDANGLKLEVWLGTQKDYYKNNLLSVDKIKKLEEIKIVWDSREALWNKQYSFAKEYYEKYGNLLIPGNYEIGGYKLGNWISNQRSFYKRKEVFLTKERIEKLEDIGMIWDANVSSMISTSLPEQVVFYYFSKTFENVINRYKFSNFEIDVFISFFKIAIEYDGSRWHKDIKKDIIKDKECLKRGIKLFRIREPLCPELNSSSYILKLKNDSYDELERVIIEIFRELEKMNLKFNFPDINIRRDLKDIVERYNLYIEKKWMDSYRIAERYYKQYGNLKVSQLCVYEDFNLGRWISRQRQGFKNNKLSEDKIKLLNSIGMFWDVLDEEWETKYSLLENYYKENGNIDILWNYKVNNINLGSWLHCLKYDYRQNILPDYKIKKLELLNITWNFTEEKWLKHYDIAKQYYNEYGNLPYKYNEIYENFNLGDWVRRQRDKFKNKKLSDEQIKLLNLIGMEWEKRKITYREEKELNIWLDKFNLLKEYCEKYGCLPTRNEKYCDVTIGSWLITQRNNYLNSKLSIEQMKLLLSVVGLNELEKSLMEQRKLNIWLDRFNLLREYYEKNGCLPSYDEKYCDFSLGKWISRQRQGFKNNKLSYDQIKLLNSMDVFLNLKDYKNKYDFVWDDHFKIAERYYKQYGNLKVTQLCVYESFNLGSWVSRQRQKFKNNKLSEDQIKLLNSIGMIWGNEEGILSSNKDIWDDHFKIAERYYKQYGNLKVTQLCVYESFNLGSWVSRQRQKFKNNKLSENRIKLLNSIGMIWGNEEGILSSNKDIWNSHFKIAERYYKQYGNLKVTYNYVYESFNLGRWISKQREKFNNNKLSENRIKLLNSIGIIWDARKKDKLL